MASLHQQLDVNEAGPQRLVELDCRTLRLKLMRTLDVPTWQEFLAKVRMNGIRWPIKLLN